LQLRQKKQGLHSYFANLFGESAVARSVVTQWWGLVACLEDVAGFCCWFVVMSLDVGSDALFVLQSFEQVGLLVNGWTLRTR
jgi:hypothetical protein